MKHKYIVRPRLAMLVALWLFAATLPACGGGGGPPPPPPVPQPFEVVFTPGPMPLAVRADLTLMDPEPIESVMFTVQTKPGNVAEDVEVTYARTFLVREGELDETLGEIGFTIFGLYFDYANQVTIQVNFPASPALTRPFVITTPNTPPIDPAQPLTVNTVDPALSMNFMFAQRLCRPAIIDIDGEIRWTTPDMPDPGFPFTFDSEGIVMGSRDTPAIFQVDWLGQVTETAMSDARLDDSHHTIEPGKTGLLNTVGFVDGILDQPESVLAEMTAAGVVTRIWDFDQIFSDHITANLEDPQFLVTNGTDWFHMNSAIYDASDDSIIASSRENFIVKIDYTTGAIKWILGNPAKHWYTTYPNSLQNLALTVIGNPPIGQHALSVSADGTMVTCLNNGQGHVTFPDIGDTTNVTTVSVYSINTTAGTATEILSLDCGATQFSPFASSAYRTAAGNMLTVLSTTMPPRVCVITDAGQILFDADVTVVTGCGTFSAKEIGLEGMLIE